MFWALLFVGAAGMVAGTIAFWRHWIGPWERLADLVSAVRDGRPPSSFVMQGNEHARAAALALETIFLRQRMLSERVGEDEYSIRSILAAMPDGLAVVDERSRIRILNPALRAMFGLRDGGIGGSLLEELRDASIARMVSEALRLRAPVRESLRFDARGQGQREVAVSALPITRETGAPLGAVLLFQDVTHLQQLENVRREFVSNVSHELRTPLSIFRGYLETLLDEPDLPPAERRRIVGVLEKHSSRLQSLVDDLLSLARLEAPEPSLHLTRFALRPFVEGIVVDWEKKAAAKKLRLTIVIPDRRLSVTADESRLEEILYNLLDNAVKYSPKKGEIVIAAHQREDLEFVVLEVRDAGSGIPSSDLPRVFERFYRADKARSRELGGTGLGLAIVKHIAQLHGGRVEAESELGRGTTVRLLLPVSHAQE